MRAATPPIQGYVGGGSRESRIAALVLAVVATLLVVWLLIRLGLVTVEPPQSSAMKTISLNPGSSPQPTQRKQSAKHAAHEKAAAATPRRSAAATVPPPLVQTPPPPKSPWNVIWMSHDEMAASDISTMPSHKAERMAAAAAASGSGKGHDRGDAGGKGDGPGGVMLYAAEWYRRPTHAETSTYFQQAGARPGWGDVACRTAPGYRVEDCQELEESPGSHISRAVREAAWQFRILPPRVDGKPMVGTWVRIHFTLTETGGDAG